MPTTDTDDNIPVEKIELYLKVAALAEQGAPGEKEQAERTLAKLRLKYPGIEFLVDERMRAQKKTSRRAPEPPPGAPKQAFWSAYTRTFESVSKILADITEILSDVNEESEAQAAIDDAMDVSGKTVKVRGSDKFRLIVDIDAAVLADVLQSLDDTQVERVARHIGGRISDALVDSFLGDESEDDEDEESE